MATLVGFPHKTTILKCLAKTNQRMEGNLHRHFTKRASMSGESGLDWRCGAGMLLRKSDLDMHNNTSNSNNINNSSNLECEDSSCGWAQKSEVSLTILHTISFIISITTFITAATITSITAATTTTTSTTNSNNGSNINNIKNNSNSNNSNNSSILDCRLEL